MVDFEKKPEDGENTGRANDYNPTESYPIPGNPIEVQPTQAYPTAFGANPEYPPPPPYPEATQPEMGNPPQWQNPGGEHPGAYYPAPAHYPPPAQDPPAAQFPPDAQFPPAAQYPAAGQYPAVPHFPAAANYGNQPTYLPPQPYYSYPVGYQGVGPDAPFGRDPITGEPLSDKSKVAAGLLQILLGGFGAGRFYIGSNGVAVAQLLLLIFGWLTVVLGIGVLVLLGLGVWVLVDGIVMLVGNAKDGNGRRLRN